MMGTDLDIFMVASPSAADLIGKEVQAELY
jgi:hypothetical protein